MIECKNCNGYGYFNLESYEDLDTGLCVIDSEECLTCGGTGEVDEEDLTNE